MYEKIQDTLVFILLGLMLVVLVILVWLNAHANHSPKPIPEILITASNGTTSTQVTLSEALSAIDRNSAMRDSKIYEGLGELARLKCATSTK